MTHSSLSCMPLCCFLSTLLLLLSASALVLSASSLSTVNMIALCCTNTNESEQEHAQPMSMHKQLAHSVACVLTSALCTFIETEVRAGDSAANRECTHTHDRLLSLSLSLRHTAVTVGHMPSCTTVDTSTLGAHKTYSSTVVSYHSHDIKSIYSSRAPAYYCHSFSCWITLHHTAVSVCTAQEHLCDVACVCVCVGVKMHCCAVLACNQLHERVVLIQVLGPQLLTSDRRSVVL
jgi:hypothetical protein